jgi:alkylation response protein AidB-like acyl-CoA dehydrogenase
VDFGDTAVERAWRNEVREFIEQNLGVDRLRRLSDEMGMGGWDTTMPWRQKLAERGWIAPAWPREYGGAALSVMQQFILNEEMALARAPSAGGLATAMLGPTLIAHGTPEQQAEHLPRILRGEVVWCQGFSEPGAGSDLAALQTRAVRDGDEYVVNGQKIWTTGAQYADWIFLLVRTDPDAPKHKGISFLVVDMRAPGITIRPIIDMAGGHHVNETFFDNVRVPVRNRVGPENRGWYVATTTLDFERSGIKQAIANRLAVEELLAVARGSPAVAAGAMRYELAERYIECVSGRLFAWRIAWMQDQGLIPNYEASVSKLFNTELRQRINNTGMRLGGLGAIVLDARSPWAKMEGAFAWDHMDAVPATISAGSSEVQRNIIATRGLGLPRA